jgi:transposase
MELIEQDLKDMKNKSSGNATSLYSETSIDMAAADERHDNSEKDIFGYNSKRKIDL